MEVVGVGKCWVVVVMGGGDVMGELVIVWIVVVGHRV